MPGKRNVSAWTLRGGVGMRHSDCRDFSGRPADVSHSPAPHWLRPHLLSEMRRNVCGAKRNQAETLVSGKGGQYEYRGMEVPESPSRDTAAALRDQAGEEVIRAKAEGAVPRESGPARLAVNI